MPPDDDYRKAQQLRRKEVLLALILGGGTLISNACYIIFLRRLGTVYLAIIISCDLLVMIFIYLLLVSKMRRRGK